MCFQAWNWGLEHSARHYLDLLSAILGLALFPTGYLLQAFFVITVSSIVAKSPYHSLTLFGHHCSVFATGFLLPMQSLIFFF